MQFTESPREAKSAISPVKENSAVLKQLRLGLTKQYYAMANALGLKRLQDYFQGASTLAPSEGIVWILGEKYDMSTGNASQKAEVSSKVLEDYQSRIWMSYRRNFPPLGSSSLTSDVGWGCTLRSGQMLLAQVLSHHLSGRQWRKSEGSIDEHSELAKLLALFWDNPGEEHMFSLHHLMIVGRRHGVKAGEWLGPWTLCHTLEAIVNLNSSIGLRVHLVNTPGGGAPVLYTCSVEDLMAGSGSKGIIESKLQTAVLLLIPLVLGIGKVDSRYIPQLKTVLQWPQSAGIVGGRPSSSLYFVGQQADQIIFMDPHQVQEVGNRPQDIVSTYFCSEPRVMQLASIDPSLAIGFYCRSPESFEDLKGRLRNLEKESGNSKSGGTPLLNVVEGRPPPPFAELERCSSTDEGDASKGHQNWELL